MNTNQILIIIFLFLCSIYLFIIIKKIKHYISNMISWQKDCVQYISKIEARMSTPFKEFFNTNKALEDWIVVTSFNREEKLRITIESIHFYEPNAKILVIDNGSDKETTALIYELFENTLIDKLLTNHHQDVPQWQKSFSMAQAIKILSLENINHGVTWIDDDMIVKRPWLQAAKAIIDDYSENNIKIVTCHQDKTQEQNHPTEDTFKFEGISFHLKSTFNGSFFYTPIEFIEAVGMPPICEGYSIASTEDWYYSRQLLARGWKVATLDCSIDNGHKGSQRKKL